MLAEVRAAKSAATAAENRLLVLAAEWADAHPVLTEDPEPYAAADADADPLDPFAEEAREFDPERGIPQWSWKAAASFAAAVGRSTSGGDAMIRDALVLRHRLPRIWSRVVGCEVEAWRGRRIAQAVLGRPTDVCAHLDSVLDDIAQKVGTVTLDRLIDEAMLRLYPEEREAEQLAALDHRHVTLREDSINHTGMADMDIRGDWKDLHDFDQAASRVAAALAATDREAGRYVESLDVRRSRAVGVLADPAAQALLAHQPPPKPSKRTTLFVHLSDLAVLGLEPLGRNETTGAATLEQAIRGWCGRGDTHLTVQPVIDLNDHLQVEAYEVRDRFETRNRLLHPICVFPWCTKPARRCDRYDPWIEERAKRASRNHRVPHDQGGATCDCNIAPLCRHHHSLKTHAGWRYTQVEPGTWLWSDPHGQQLLRDPAGTLDVTPPDRPVNHRAPPDIGCRHDP